MNLVPRVSEKAYVQSSNNVYLFEVPVSSTKIEVKKAVQEQFKVTVVKVRTVRQKGKKISSNRKRQRPVAGYRANMKKAYVTLAKGDSLSLFEEVEA